MTSAGDPVRSGLSSSYARPGGNITGLSFLVTSEIVGKQLELLKEIVPRVSRVAVLWNPTNPTNYLLEEAKSAARSLGVHLQAVDAQAPDDFERAFAAMTREHAGALLVLPDGMFLLHRRRLTDLAAKSRLPAMYGYREDADAGGLAFYGPSLRDNFRRAAIFVDKILKGAKPGDLPVEQPTKFEFVINLKTAKALGMTIPPSPIRSSNSYARSTRSVPTSSASSPPTSRTEVSMRLQESKCSPWAAEIPGQLFSTEVACF